MSRYNNQFAVLFSFPTIVFLILFFSSCSFFNWVFERHQNQLSWYIRPLFLILFFYFAYRRSLDGIAFTDFCIFSSMLRFTRPEAVSEEVRSFLEFEKKWLTGSWISEKLLVALTVPVSFAALGFAF